MLHRPLPSTAASFLAFQFQKPEQTVMWSAALRGIRWYFQARWTKSNESVARLTGGVTFNWCPPGEPAAVRERSMRRSRKATTDRQWKSSRELYVIPKTSIWDIQSHPRPPPIMHQTIFIITFHYRSMWDVSRNQTALFHVDSGQKQAGWTLTVDLPGLKMFFFPPQTFLSFLNRRTRCLSNKQGL